jgi:hypothetical protein
VDHDGEGGGQLGGQLVVLGCLLALVTAGSPARVAVTALVEGARAGGAQPSAGAVAGRLSARRG